MGKGKDKGRGRSKECAGSHVAGFLERRGGFGGGLVTIDPGRFATKPCDSITSGFESAFAGKQNAFILFINRESIIESIYALILQEIQTKPTTTENTLVLMNEVDLSSAYSILKHLFSKDDNISLMKVSKRSSVKEAKRVLNCSLQRREKGEESKSAFVLLEVSHLNSVDFSKHSFPRLFTVNYDMQASRSAPFKAALTHARTLIVSIIGKEAVFTRTGLTAQEFHLEKRFLRLSSGRVRVARQLSQLLATKDMTGLTTTTEERAMKERALRQRIQVLKHVDSANLEDEVSRVDENNKMSTKSSKFISSKESERTIRKKMALLGMLERDASGAEVSSSGRDLARTRWLDRRRGDEHNAPWGEVRMCAYFTLYIIHYVCIRML